MTAVRTRAVQPAAGVAGSGFGSLWFGEGVSLLGTSATSVLLPLLAVVTLGAGPGWLGAITAAAWLPWVVVGLPAGALVDRLPPRAVMITADLVSAAALVSVPLAAWWHALTILQLVAVALTVGVATVFFRTAYLVLVTLVVEPARLETANARLLGTEAASQVAGPGLGAVLLSVASAATGLLADVASFAVSAMCLLRVRPRKDGRAPMPPGARRIREAVGTVARDPFLRAITLVGGGSNFGLTGLNTLLVLYLLRTLGLSPTQVAVTVAVGEAGGIAGAAAASTLGRRFGNGRASTLALIVAAPAAVLVALPDRPSLVPVTVAGLLVLSAAVVAGNVLRGSWRQRYVPRRMLGSVITASQLVNYGTMPLAALSAGALASAVGVRPAVLLFAGVHAIACIAVLATRFGRCTVLPVSRAA